MEEQKQARPSGSVRMPELVVHVFYRFHGFLVIEVRDNTVRLRRVL